MLERARAFGDWVVRPLARLLVGLRVPPDVVSWVGTLAVCVAALITIPNGWLWQGALIVGLLSLSDTLDGAMARLLGRERTWGAFLDSSLDRVADGALFGAVLIHVVQTSPWSSGALGGYGLPAEGEAARYGEWSVQWAEPGLSWMSVLALVVLVLGQLTSYVKARAESLGGEGGGGPGARADRIVIIVVSLLLEGLGVPFALALGLLVLAVLGVITVAVRMRRAKASFGESSGEAPA
ncbi:CDP-alcohol phosphatidyltransferase family protein [Naumannella halotolerans]|uniref:CDP-alcohol phosphatidyltransferase family protein n=1 Tax=Naumannella halotolerans TaxID=993414 RepID=UPI00370D8687